MSLSIKVHTPVRESATINSFISYTVDSNADGGVSHRVSRRYRDFLWLRDQLFHGFPGVIIPPLPEKSMLSRFDPNFISERLKYLQVFVDRIAEHPLLHKHKSVQAFLEMESDFPPAYSDDTSSSKLFSWLRASPPAGSKTQDDLSFEEIQVYIAGLIPLFEQIRNHAHQFAVKLDGMMGCLKELSAAFSALSQTESAPLDGLLAVISSATGQLSAISKEQSALVEAFFHDPVCDFLRTLAAAQDAVKQRNEFCDVYKVASANLDSKNTALARAKGTPERAQQLATAQQDVNKAQAELVQAKQAYDDVAQRLLVEFDRFKIQKLAFYKRVLLDFVHAMMVCDTKVEQVWEKSVEKLSSLGVAEM